MERKSVTRSLSGLLVFALLSISAPIQAAANPKSGASCPKVGVTQNYQGKKFTCVKSGKKKIWDRGVSAPTSDPFTQFGVDAARYKALDAYTELLIKNKKVGVPAISTVLQSPNDPRVSTMVANGQYAFEVYEGMEPLGYIPQYIIGEKEEWMRSTVTPLCEILGRHMAPNAGSANCQIVEVWRGIDRRDDAFMSRLMTAQGGHEIFHLYQQKLWGKNWASVPDWFREGSANVGMVAILSRFDGIKTFSNYGSATVTEGSPRDARTCTAALDDWESNTPSKGFGYYKNCEYGLGLIMNEFLIMKGYTLADVLETIRRIGNGEPFPVAFESVYKMSTAQYFAELRTYLKTLNLGW